MLPGSDTRPADVEVIYQSRATRLSRALVVLGVTLLVMPVVFFIPPHFVWSLAALGAGLYLARRYWIGQYYVVSFAGACPRCGADLEIGDGTRIGRTHSLDCYGCHRQPQLVVEDVDE